MLIGYARTSTAEQVAGVDDQKRELEKAGVERIYAEHVSAVAKARPQFDIVMSMLRAGDVLVVTKLDRLARSMT
jgi:DNA invertase Pin-like site-specific DNA recombinase